MSVIVSNVIKNSPAHKIGLKSGDTLVSLNNNAIIDVLDYRFYQNEKRIVVEFINSSGKLCKKTVKKSESEELGLEFETYLMLHKYGAPPHGGLGLGLERLTMHLLGCKNVREATMFPRDINRVTP